MDTSKSPDEGLPSRRRFLGTAGAAFALDILALMDALKIKSAVLAGFDWGSRTGDIIAALWPARCKALISVTGYLITIDGKYDPFTPPGNGSAYRDHFTGPYKHMTFPVGHNVPQEAPESFAEAVVEVTTL